MRPEDHDAEDHDSRDPDSRRGARHPTRRAFIASAVKVGVGVGLADLAAAAAEDLASARPREGDRFVFFLGDRQGELIGVEDLAVGGPQVLAYPFDPETKTVRDGSRLNQVVLVRFEPGQLSEETRKVAAEGVVAYSAVCTHQGCPVSMWKEDAKTLFCACHGSQFDPTDGARKVDGPAPRRLARLPLKVQDGALMAAGGFVGRVGFKKKG